MSQSIYYRWALDLTWHFPHPVCLISAQAPLHNPVIHTLHPPHGTEEHLHLVPASLLKMHKHKQHPHGVEQVVHAVAQPVNQPSL